MNKHILPVLYGFCLMVTAYSPAFSYETISIDVSPDIKTDNHMLAGTVMVRNNGNVAARNVHVEVFALGETVAMPPVETIDPGQVKTFHTQKDIGAIPKGSYPFVITVYFYDSKLYPFSAVSCSIFMVKGNLKKTDIICAIHDLDIQKQGRLHVTLKNTGNIRRDIKATLVIPKEFESPDVDVNVETGPGREDRIKFDIMNLKAMPGAVYPVFCIFEYDDPLEGSHTAVMAKADVTIIKKENWFRKTQWRWLAAGLFFPAACVAVAIRRVRRLWKR